MMMLRRLCVAALLVVSTNMPAAGQSYAPVQIQIQDEGVTQARARVLNCVGSGIVCAVSGHTATVTVSGGVGGFSVTNLEIDFDTCGVGVGKGSRICKQTVTDAAVSATSKLDIFQDGTAATSRQADENEMDPLQCRGIPAAGSFTLICSALEGPAHGKYRVSYAIG